MCYLVFSQLIKGRTFVTYNSQDDGWLNTKHEAENSHFWTYK
jgi:hypothetical protein